MKDSQAASDPLRLTLVRHAKSAWRFGTLDDFHRPLNARGLRDAVHVPPLLAARLPAPDLILCSDAVRAVQTCEAIATAFDLDAACVRLDHALYLADAEGILAVLADTGGGARHLMVVAHNPGLTDLYNHLLHPPLDNLPTLAVATLTLEAAHWPALAAGCGRLDWLLRPREILQHG